MMEKTQRKEKNERAQSLFTRILFIVLWTRSTIMPYVAQVFRRVPVLGQFYEYFTTAVILILVIFAFNKIVKKIKLLDVLFLLGLSVIVLCSLSFYPKNAEYIEPELLSILFSVLPMYLFGVCYDHELVKKDLFIGSLAGLFLQGFLLVISLDAGEVGYGYDMHAAYIALPNAMYVLYWAFEKKKIVYWIPPILALALLVVYGTRGAVLALILYFGFLLFVSASSKKKALRIFLLLLIAVLAVAFVTSSLFFDLMEKASDFFNELGFGGRIFDKFLEEELADDSGRSYTSMKIATAIDENWLFGLGFMGDRVVLDGSYAHNLFLEFICSFGVFVGTIIIIFLLSLTISALRKTYLKPEFRFVALIITFVFTKLMFSLSYAIEPYFYFMLGVCISMTRKYNRRTVEKNETIKKNH